MFARIARHGDHDGAARTTAATTRHVQAEEGLVGWLVACWTVCVCVAPVSNYLLLLLLLNSTTCRTLLRHRSSSRGSSVTLLPPPIGRPSSHCSLARSIVKGAVCKVLASTLPSPHLSAQLEHTRRTFSQEHSCLCRFTIFLLLMPAHDRLRVHVQVLSLFLSFPFRCADNAISALTLPADDKSCLPAWLPMFAVAVEYSVRDDLARSYIDPPPPPGRSVTHSPGRRR